MLAVASMGVRLLSSPIWWLLLPAVLTAVTAGLLLRRQKVRRSQDPAARRARELAALRSVLAPRIRQRQG